MQSWVSKDEKGESVVIKSGSSKDEKRVEFGPNIAQKVVKTANLCHKIGGYWIDVVVILACD